MYWRRAEKLVSRGESVKRWMTEKKGGGEKAKNGREGRRQAQRRSAGNAGVSRLGPSPIAGRQH